MPYLSLVLLGLVLAWGALQRAAVEVPDWHLCVIATGVVTGLYFLLTLRRPRVPFLNVAAWAPLMVFTLLVLIQVIPMPLGWVKVLSPARAEHLAAALPFASTTPPAAPLSAVPYLTWEYLLTVLGYLVILLVVRDITFRTSDTAPWSCIWPILLVAAAEGMLGFYQTYEGSGQIASGTYDSRDHFAGLLEMALPFAVMYAIAVLLRDRRRDAAPAGPAIKACGLLAIAAILLIAIIHSLSRMGFIVALAVLSVCGSLALSMRGLRVEYEEERPRWRRFLPFVLVAVVVTLGFIYLPTDPLIARFSEFAKTDDITADVRAQIWRDSVGIVKAYPLTGCGLGTYESCFYKFKTVAPMYTVNYAHNDYLQVLAEMGVPGFAVALFFISYVLYRTTRSVLYARSIDARYLSTACVASVIGMLLHSLVDFNMYVPMNGFTFAWILGVSCVSIRSRQHARAVQPE